MIAIPAPKKPNNSQGRKNYSHNASNKLTYETGWKDCQNKILVPEMLKKDIKQKARICQVIFLLSINFRECRVQAFRYPRGT
jgi:hypothetical protein